MTLRRRIKKLFYWSWNGFRRHVIGQYQNGGIIGLYHWIRCHTWNRYHIIDIRGIDGYKWGWIDRDHAMELACWKLLMDFVEREDPTIGHATIEDYLYKDYKPRDVELEMINEQVASNKEIRALYDWWTKGRLEEEAQEETVYQSYVAAKSTGHHANIEATADAWNRARKDTDQSRLDHLDRLIKVRQALWT